MAVLKNTVTSAKTPRNIKANFIVENIKKQLSPSVLRKEVINLFEGITKTDILLLFLFPILITILTFLPERIQDVFRLHVQSPKIWQYLTQSFFHLNYSHLFRNIVPYFLFAFIVIILANLSNSKKGFYKAFLIVVLTLPVVSSIIQVHFYPSIFPNMRVSCGSSGIIAALASFTPFFWAGYLKKRNNLFSPNIVFLFTSIFYMALFFALTYSDYHMTGLTIVAIVLFLIGLVASSKNLKIALREIELETKTSVILAFMMIVTPLLFLATPFIIFPSISEFTKNAVSSGTGIDFLMHYVGAVYGLFISGYYFIYFNKSERKNKKALRRGRSYSSNEIIWYFKRGSTVERRVLTPQAFCQTFLTGFHRKPSCLRKATSSEVKRC